jgi:hypothetical protein
MKIAFCIILPEIYSPVCLTPTLFFCFAFTLLAEINTFVKASDRLGTFIRLRE